MVKPALPTLSNQIIQPCHIEVHALLWLRLTVLPCTTQSKGPPSMRPLCFSNLLISAEPADVVAPVAVLAASPPVP